MKVAVKKPVKENFNSAKVSFEVLPVVDQMFFDQFSQIIGKITHVDSKAILVDFPKVYGHGTKTRSFLMREIEQNFHQKYWKFKEPEKQYHVWMEIVPAEGSQTKKGVWEKASNIAMSEETAKVMEKLLRQENPHLSFATSIGKPSSYFL